MRIVLDSIQNVSMRLLRNVLCFMTTVLENFCNEITAEEMSIMIEFSKNQEFYNL